MLIRFLIFVCLLNIYLCEDYYELLGVAKDAENRDIRKAFKKLALIYHPDKNKGKDDAHKKFIDINKAYEVLKDSELRKKYDLYGEEGLKEDFSKSWKANYRSWNYYHEKFGIYDDDPEIVTLSLTDFERFVDDSSDIWFVNFYSPQCSHCHILAPSWRKLAREFQDVIHIAAVNCEEDWMLCRKQNVYSYPSLILYKSKTKLKYDGSREAEDLIDYVLQNLPYNVIHLTSSNFKAEVDHQIIPLPWLIFSSEASNNILKDDLKKLGIILKHLVYVAEIDDSDNERICAWLFCDSPVTYISNLTVSVDKMNLQKVFITSLEIRDIVKEVFSLLPEVQEISSTNLEEIERASKFPLPRLIQFTREEEAKKNTLLKRLKSSLSLEGIDVGVFDCNKNSIMCTSFFIPKYPSFVLFRPDGSYEFYHGEITSYGLSRFIREALKSRVHTLNPFHFPKVTQSEETWFIDFFAPWCPPCMMLLPEYRMLSSSYDQSVKFGSVDCTVHRELCSNYNIKSYPSAVLYKNSVGHKYHGLYERNALREFIQDILNPLVVSLDPSLFEEKVSNRNSDDVWLVAFIAPWCGPCQQLSPQWRKMARMLQHLDYVHVGEVNCQTYSSYCNSMGVYEFPSIRLYPRSSMHSSKFFLYNEWNWDAFLLQAWVFKYLPSAVPTLSDDDFQDVLNDKKPWVIDFFAPWCGHCQVYAPEFEKIAKKIEGKVKAGKINCQEFPRTCKSALINSYPSVVFYRGRTGSKPQSPVAEEIQPFQFDDVISFLQYKLKSKFKVRDEL